MLIRLAWWLSRKLDRYIERRARKVWEQDSDRGENCDAYCSVCGILCARCGRPG